MMIVFQYAVDEHITLELQSSFQTQELFDLVNENRAFIGQHLAWANKVDHPRDIERYMQRDLNGMARARRWAWLIRFDGQAVGRIGLFVTMPTLQECELNYFLSKAYTGKGIITKSAKIVIDFAINVLRLKHVLIGFSTENPKSGAVAERLGFQYEYTMQDGEHTQKEWRSLHFWGILAENWQSNLKPRFQYSLDEKLSLRLYQQHQAEKKFELLRENIPEFSQWFWWANDSYSLVQEKEIAKKNLIGYAQNQTLSVTIWQQEQLVGNSTLSINQKHMRGNVGYWLDKSARGQGIMTKTVRVLLQEAFRRGVERMGILAAVDNISSRAIAERLGMQLELVQKDETFINGQFVDHIQYSLLREEWEQQQL